MIEFKGVDEHSNCPLILCGPLLRKVTTTSVTLLLCTSKPVTLRLTLAPENHQAILLDEAHLAAATQTFQAAKRLFIYMIELTLEQELPRDCWIGYQLTLKAEGDTDWKSIADLIPDLLLPNRSTPGFILKSRATPVAHGSCRKPHYPGKDGLGRIDDLLRSAQPEQWPALLMLSGDQVYADDVAGPMLVAIHRLIAQLEFPAETFVGSIVRDSDEVHFSQPHYYRRETLLPLGEASSEQARRALFEAPKKPVFTSAASHNHLISLAEMIAMYLLVWSPSCWSQDSMDRPKPSSTTALSAEELSRYESQQRILKEFVSELPKVRRTLAHIPTAMIFDDHDVTDDWNLTAGWELAAYQQPFSKRIIGNALVAYLVFQGWGNDPKRFPPALIAKTQAALAHPGSDDHDRLIAELLSFSEWHYQWPTDPPLLVLDTRTHRWRSEVNLNKPSGLMDWESLTDLQQKLLGMESVILVSPAPIFGVKLIEGIQKLVTWLGKPLLVDAENWMAHPGAANVLMNMFRHSNTPRHFTILSGDVHYSFVYRVKIRKQKNSPRIWQITSSGIRNEFPHMLLGIFDRINRWLYAPWSPLNWFTKRRRMRVTPYQPRPSQVGERLVNASGIGLVEFDDNDEPAKITQLCADGRNIEFNPHTEAARWE